MNNDARIKAIEDFMEQLMPGVLFGLVVSGTGQVIKDHFVTGHRGCTPQQVRSLLIAGTKDLDNYMNIMKG